jgi:hypothetical protein
MCRLHPHLSQETFESRCCSLDGTDGPGRDLGISTFSVAEIGGSDSAAEANANEKKILLQCRFITQRNWSQKDSTSNEMHAIDCIAIHSVDDDDDDECQTKEYSSA